MHKLRAFIFALSEPCASQKGKEQHYAELVSNRLRPPARALSARALPQRVYVVALCHRDVVRACTNFQQLYKSKVALVPTVERQQVLEMSATGRHPCPDIKSGTWVRVKRGRYRGDIGLVLKSPSRASAIDGTGPSRASLSASDEVDADEPEDDIFTVATVPRLVPESEQSNSQPSDPIGGGDTSRTSSGDDLRAQEPSSIGEKRKRRIPPSLFDAEKMMEVYGASAVQRIAENEFKFRGLVYRKGLYEFDVFGFHTLSKISPTLYDVEQFVMSGLSFPTLVNKAFLRLGDKVRITRRGGEQEGLRGRVTSIVHNEIVCFADVDTGKTVEAKLAHVERFFESGDWVVVRLGPRRGCSGMVTKVDGQRLELFDAKANETVSIYRH